MPELPEVETFRRFVDQYALNRKIQTIRVFTPKILEKTSEHELHRVLEGRCFYETQRVGKHLLIGLQAPTRKQLPWLFLHFGMTGYLSYEEAGQTFVNAYGDPSRPNAHIRAQFEFESGGRLNFHEQRMFGKLGLTEDAEAYFQAKKLGPDALSIPKNTFLKALKTRKGTIKPVLMDQSLVAGIGNVYADELLYQCGIHPERKIADLKSADLNCIYAQMVSVLENTVAVSADRNQLPQTYMLHDRRPKGFCPREKHAWEIKTIGGRTTYFCPTCQKL